MAGNAGQHVNARVAVDGEVNLHRPQRDGPVGGQRKGCAAQLHRVNAQQQVVHDGVAHKSGFQNVLGRNTGLRGHIDRQRVERRAHRSRHFHLAAGVHHDVGHAAHQVFAKADLRVHHPGRRHHVARRQIAQVRGDGGRAHIHRQAIHMLFEAGPHRNDLLARVHRHRHFPVACAQRGLQLLQDQHVARQIGELPFKVQRVF